jgi:periplasmic protein CpxP/Spy
MTTLVRRFGLGLGAALVVLGAIAAVHASSQNTAAGPAPFMGHRNARGMGGGLPFGRLAGQLGLSDAQKDQIKTIMQSHRDEWKSLADRASAARKALNDAVTADTVDENAIRQASAAQAAVQADMAVTRARVHAEVFQVLTPDQQKQAKELRAQMKAKQDQFRQRLEQRRGGQP